MSFKVRILAMGGVVEFIRFSLKRSHSFYSLQYETSYNALRCESTCSKSMGAQDPQ